MNLPKHYSLKKEHDRSFEIHDGRDKSSFHVYKKDLHPATQIKIMKMQKLNEGTDDVEPEDQEELDQGPSVYQNNAQLPGISEDQGQDSEQDQAPVGIAQNPAPQSSMDQMLPSAAPEQQHGASADWEAPSTQPAQQMGSPPQGGGQSYVTPQEVRGSVQKQQAAKQQEATATQALNTNLAALQGKQIKAEQDFMDKQMSALQGLKDNYNQTWKEVSEGKIKPFWEGKSTGQMISGVIGIILGGIGSGLTGGPNSAILMLNKAIDQDLEVQKQNLGKKQSLLSENLRSQGSLISAMNSTRLQMQAMHQGQLTKMAQESGNPVIQARAKMANEELFQHAIPLMNQSAGTQAQMQIRGDVLQRLQNQGKPGSAPVDLFDLSRAGLVDKGTAEKETTSILKRQQSEAYIIDQVKKLDEEQRVWGSGNIIPNIVNPESYKRRDMFKAGVLQAIQNASPSKKLSPEMLSLEAEPFLTKTMDSDQTRQEGLMGLLGLIKQHADPTPTASKFNIHGAAAGDKTVPKRYKMGEVK